MEGKSRGNLTARIGPLRIIAAIIGCLSCSATFSMGYDGVRDAEMTGGNILRTGSGRETSGGETSIVILGASYARG